MAVTLLSRLLQDQNQLNKAILTAGLMGFNCKLDFVVSNNRIQKRHRYLITVIIRDFKTRSFRDFSFKMAILVSPRVRKASHLLFHSAE